MFQEAQLRADFFQYVAHQRSDWVVITFTERFNRDLNGPGFGTEFLLAGGFDVLAVKSSADDWYAKLSDDKLSSLARVLSPYPDRASYGSSMGGFAAIKFAKRLGIARSVAISPIQDIRYDWDIRHYENISALGELRDLPLGDLISAQEISPHTTYHIAFDPYNREDARHAQILRGMIPRYAAFKVRWGGHPVGPTLRDTGILSAFVLNAIKSNDTSKLEFKTPRTGQTLRNRARYLLDRNRPRLALVASTRAVELSPEWEETCILQAQVLHRLGKLDEAVPYGLKAVELEPGSQYIPTILARILIDRGNLKLAEEVVRAAINRVGRHEALVGVLVDLGLETPANLPFGADVIRAPSL